MQLTPFDLIAAKTTRLRWNGPLPQGLPVCSGWGKGIKYYIPIRRLAHFSDNTLLSISRTKNRARNLREDTAFKPPQCIGICANDRGDHEKEWKTISSSAGIPSPRSNRCFDETRVSHLRRAAFPDSRFRGNNAPCIKTDTLKQSPPCAENGEEWREWSARNVKLCLKSWPTKRLSLQSDNRLEYLTTVYPSKTPVCRSMPAPK